MATPGCRCSFCGAGASSSGSSSARAILATPKDRSGKTLVQYQRIDFTTLSSIAVFSLFFHQGTCHGLMDVKANCGQPKAAPVALGTTKFGTLAHGSKDSGWEHLPAPQLCLNQVFVFRFTFRVAQITPRAIPIHPQTVVMYWHELMLESYKLSELSMHQVLRWVPQDKATQ